MARARWSSTSRQRGWGYLADELRVELFDLETATTYVRRRVAAITDAEMAVLHEQLGGLALALAQAAAYLSETNSAPGDYLAELAASDRPPDHLDAADPNARTVAQTLALSIAHARKVDPLSGQLLELMAFLAADEIPSALLIATADDGPGWPKAEVNRALGILSRLSLIESDEPGTHGMHRLVAQVLRADLHDAGGAGSTVTLCADLLAARVPYPSWDPARWADYAPLAPHAERLARHIVSLGTTGVGAAQLVMDLGMYEGTRLGELAHAAGHLGLAHALYQDRLGAEHPATLRSRSNLAGTLHDQGDLAGARAYQERVLAIQRRILGDEHPDTLTSRNNLALTLYAQSDAEGAIELLTDALVGAGRTWGEDHPNTQSIARTLRQLL